MLWSACTVCWEEVIIEVHFSHIPKQWHLFITPKTATYHPLDSQLCMSCPSIKSRHPALYTACARCTTQYCWFPSGDVFHHAWHPMASAVDLCQTHCLRQVHNTVPSWSVPVISTCGPAAVLAAYYFMAAPTRLEIHNTLLGCLTCVIATALATNLVKLSVRAKQTPEKSYMRVCAMDPMRVACPSPL